MHVSERMFNESHQADKKAKGTESSYFSIHNRNRNKFQDGGNILPVCRCQLHLPLLCAGRVSVQLFQKEQRIPVRIIVLNGKLFLSDEFEAHFPVEFVCAATDGR